MVYSATKRRFLQDNNDQEIDEVVRDCFLDATRRRIAASEQHSLRELLYIAWVLPDDGIPDDAGIAMF